MADERSRLVVSIAKALQGREEVAEAYLFGSQARGDAQAHSDVDVAVYLDPHPPPACPFGYAAGLTTDLMAALGRSDVEVVVLNKAPPLLYHRVLRDGLRVCSKNLAQTTTREGYALSRYCDFKPFLERVNRLLAGQGQ